MNSAQGVPRQIEIHRHLRSPSSDYEQALLNGWTGGNGPSDCPLALKAFDPYGTSYGVYVDYSYGPGWDLH